MHHGGWLRGLGLGLTEVYPYVASPLYDFPEIVRYEFLAAHEKDAWIRKEVDDGRRLIPQLLVPFKSLAAAQGLTPKTELVQKPLI
jgi:hypothetical protein